MITRPVLLALLVGLIGCRTQPATTPDVVIVTLDTTRADHVGAYGYARSITPAIDAFARDAVRYSRVWSTASWTLPAHASLLTGLYPTSHGAHFNMKAGKANLGEVVPGDLYTGIKVNRLSDDAVTIAELLHGRGYATAAFVGGPWLAPVFGLLQGYVVKDAEIVGLGGRRADELTRRAVAWIDSVPREQPIHMLVNYFDPHAPYDPPAGFDRLPAAKVHIRTSILDVNRGRRLSPSQRAAYVDRYDGEISFMDHYLGQLLEALRAAGRYETALIIVVGDHGESFGEHGLMEHGRWLYEEVLHVPLIVRFPGGRGSGTTIDTPVSIIDLFPLIAREAKLAVPSNVEGLPIGERTLVVAEAFRDALAIQGYGPRFDRHLTALIRWPWKLIWSDRGPSQLYRLDEDAAELRNRAGEAQEAELLDALAAVQRDLVPPAHAAAPQAVDPRTQEQLRALGYVQ